MEKKIIAVGKSILGWGLAGLPLLCGNTGGITIADWLIGPVFVDIRHYPIV